MPIHYLSLKLPFRECLELMAGRLLELEDGGMVRPWPGLTLVWHFLRLLFC